MSIAIIVAASDNGVIGIRGGLPWSLPGDMRFFKTVTMGHPVIMGRVTWESIPAKFRPLTGRRNIVITRDAGFAAEGAEVASSIEAAIALAKGENAFVIGGASVYAECLRLGLVDFIFLTRVHTELEGDAFFRLEEREWKLIKELNYSANDNNAFAYSFCLFVRLPMTAQLSFSAMGFQKKMSDFK